MASFFLMSLAFACLLAFAISSFFVFWQSCQRQFCLSELKVAIGAGFILLFPVTGLGLLFVQLLAVVHLSGGVTWTSPGKHVHCFGAADISAIILAKTLNVLRPSRYVIVLSLHDAVPALVYVGGALALRHEISMGDEQWFVENHVYLAAPHILLGMVASFSGWSPKDLAVNLGVANVVLLLFSGWLVTQVPEREAGLAWILYPPLVLVVLVLAWLVRRFNAPTPQGSRPGPE